MFNPYGDGPGLNRFLLVSVLLHALLFVVLPSVESVFEPNLPSMAGGGVVQIMHVESSAVARQSPIVDPQSQFTTPRVTEPRPRPEVEEPETTPEEAVASTQEPEAEEIEVEVGVERGQPVSPEPPTVPEPTVRETPSSEEPGELLTSPDGPEVVVDTEELEPEPSEQETEPGGISGYGTGAAGEDDQGGASESGEGEAESAPPIPAPPASGNSIYPGGGGPVFPKDAAHTRLEGSVGVIVHVSTDGRLLDFFIVFPSGDAFLDDYVRNYMERDWRPIPLELDYSMNMTIIFRDFNTHIEYGEIQWLNVNEP